MFNQCQTVNEFNEINVNDEISDEHCNYLLLITQHLTHSDTKLKIEIQLEKNGGGVGGLYLLTLLIHK